MAVASQDRVDARTPETAPRERRGPVELGWAAATALVALLAAVPSLGLLRWDPRTPFALGQDDVAISMQLKTIDEHGWYWRNPDLGFPFGLNGSWFPELNVLHVALVKVLDVVLGSGYTAGGVYFVLSVPLTGATMYLLARSQGLSPVAGLVGGVLLANAPGHADRYGHLYLAQYWVVPVALWLVLEVSRGRALWRGRVLDALPRRVVTVAAVLVVGLSGAYYVGYTLLLLVVATVARRVVGRPEDLLRGLGVAVGLVAAIAGPLVLAKTGTAGDLVTGRVPASRVPYESELYAGKLMDLLLPWPEHRVDALAALSQAYSSTTAATVEVSALGVVGVAGLVVLSAVGLGALLSGRRPGADLGRWSGLALVSFLLYTVGGLGSFVAVFGTPQLRTWSRMSLYLLVLCLLAVGLLLTRLQRRRGVVVAAVVGALVTTVGVLDQTNPDAAPDHASVTTQMRTLQAYTDDLEAATGRGCGVFQTPVVAYPESGPHLGLEDYDQLKPYLADSSLRFSAGAMRGTAASTWQRAVDTTDLRALGQSLRAAGFCAVEVATAGFAADDDPTPRLTQAFGPPVARSADGQFVAYRLPDLEAGADVATLRRDLLEPVLVGVDGLGAADPGEGAGRPVARFSSLSVANLGAEDRAVVVDLSVRGRGPTAREVVVRAGDRVLARADVPAGAPATLTVPVTVPSGLVRLTVELTGPAERSASGGPEANGTVSVRAVSGPPGVRVAVEQDRVASGWVVP